jgi:hypothetical protein
VTGVPEKVTVYNKKLSNQCNLTAQIEQEQDKYIFFVILYNILPWKLQHGPGILNNYIRICYICISFPPPVSLVVKI